MTQIIYQNGEPRWNETDRKNRRTQRKTRIIATLSTTTPTWNDEGANLGFRGERPATNRLSHSTAWIKVTGTYEGIRVLDVSGHLKSVSQFQSLALRSLSLSARHPPTHVTVLDDDGRVLDGSAHLLSRALMSQSASVPRCTLSAHHPPSYVQVTSDITGVATTRRKQVFGMEG
jgi:hypothetical protein